MPDSNYRATLVPALLALQHEHGYLSHTGLEGLSRQLAVPLYRLQEVASFFPHFHLAPPRPVTVRVCRDMSCHMAGSAKILRELGSLAGDDVAVEGVSCLGRCDRAPAACVAVAGHHDEPYYLGRSVEELAEIARSGLRHELPAPDLDAGYDCMHGEVRLDPYGDGADYLGLRKVIAARNASLDGAEAQLRAEGWEARAQDQFRAAALRGDVSTVPEVATAVLAWQTADDWAKELGDWSEPFFAEMKAADLRGLGGAGIPAIQKWRDVRDAVRNLRRRRGDDRAFIVVNGDESEPGTFKDREILLRMPRVVVESVIMAGLLTEASQGFIFIRHEYGEQIAACREEIRRAEQMGLCGVDAAELGRSFVVEVFVSPGGYICGEQSALIEAMSDRRGEPRNMPPKLETNGLQDLPTLVSNVETFAWVPFICVKGGKAYADEGVNGWHGRRLFSISGDVVRPGVYEVPMGLTLRELIHGDEYCRGMAGGRALKAFAPSGPSGGFLPAKLKEGAGLPRKHVENKAWKALAARRGIDPSANEIDILDLELELNLFRSLSPTAALGAGMVVYAEGRDLLAEAVKSLEFFRNESCGKCVPCRTGSQKFASLGAHLLARKVTRARWENELAPLLQEMSKAIELASICGLGRSVPLPLLTVLNFFPDDLAAYLPEEAAP